MSNDIPSSFLAYNDILDQIREVCSRVNRNPSEVGLVVVSKGQTPQAIQALYAHGMRTFGESRVQELEKKQKALPADIEWHLIGSLQMNKVIKVVGNVALIHSVDSIALAEKISQLSLEKNLITSILLQVNTSYEETKHGFLPEELIEVYEEITPLKGVFIKGLMTIASPIKEPSDPTKVRKSFQTLYTLREKLHLAELSMGMSQDFHIAIEEGATLLRIGSKIFM